jgi:hypothetical protein
MNTEQTGEAAKIPYRAEIWDKFEGKITKMIWATDDAEAVDEAFLAGTEEGCTMIEEINVTAIDRE